MDEDIKNILGSYKACTLQIIEAIKNDKLDSLQKLIDERQNLVDKASNIKYKKEEMKQIYAELNLDELQKQLNSLISDKMFNIKVKMENMARNKTATNVYNRLNNYSAKIFSKKI